MYLDIAARQFGLLDRWSPIKGQFSRTIEKGERISQSRLKRDERGLWQRRFWDEGPPKEQRERSDQSIDETLCGVQMPWMPAVG